MAVLAFSGDPARGQGGPTITPNLAVTYLGPEVVVAGTANQVSGIDQVTAVIQDTSTGLYVTDHLGTIGAGAVAQAAWTALTPPPFDAGVTWRVPLTLADGTYEATITARANDGTTTVVGPLSFDVVSTTVPDLQLVDMGDAWSYYDAGNEPPGGGSWFDTTFNDSSWQIGPAELGYGEGDEATVTRRDLPGGGRVLTQYFRHTVNVPALSGYSGVDLTVLADDGFIAYLNGVEVGRNNMPGAAGTPQPYGTLANAAGEERITTISLPVSDFVAGDNVLAIAVHQASLNSSDISFSASLEAIAGAPALESNNTTGTYLLTAGDMAQCSYDGDQAVADQMADLWSTDAGVFLGLGDLAYGSGTYNQFINCYDPTIGQFKSVTWPSPGNHEHYTAPNAAGYRQYFGAAAGPLAGPTGGLWYSFDIDDHWTAIALDSDCRANDPLPGSINGDGCAVGSDQEQWLRATLEANKDRNLLAFFHHPPYSNNAKLDDRNTWPLWRALVEYGVELTLHGHEHHYERYATLDYWGRRGTNGTREFIIGSGGTFPRYDIRPQEPESDYRGTFPNGTEDFGVLQLWLRPDGYEWLWESINGLAAPDSGTSGLTPPMERAAFDGTVTSTTTGDPLSGVEVCAVAQRSSLETCATTAADGTYRIDPLIGETYNLSATLTGAPTETANGELLAAPADSTVDFAMDTPPPAGSGDVNCDGMVNVVDALVIAQYTVGLRSGSDCPLPNGATNIHLAAGDVSADGVVNIADALMIQQCEVGLTNTFCP